MALRDGEVAYVRQIVADGLPQVDAFAIADLPRLEPHWRDLAERAAEPNPFAERAFLIPATRRVAPRGLTALCVWRAPDRGRLDALAILRRARAPFGIVDVWLSELAPLAALLMDGERAVASLEAITGWLATERPAIVALGLPNLDVNGKLAQALRTVSTKHALRLAASNVRRRAALECGPGANFAASLEAKRRKEWRRLRRRLQDRGKLMFSWSREPSRDRRFAGPRGSGLEGRAGDSPLGRREPSRIRSRNAARVRGAGPVANRAALS